MFKLSETVERKFIDTVDLSDWEIETDSGWQDISSIHKTIEYEEWLIETESGIQLICADTHILFDEFYNEIFVKDLIINKSKVITKNGEDLIVNLYNLKEKSNMYDITVESEDHRFYSNNILSHNSVTTISFILWSILFNDDYATAILANKGALAREQLNRLQKAYEYLPKWLQQGIVTWNKGSVELENGSKVFAYATSSSGVRGSSFNLIMLDEFAFVQHNMALEFFQSTYPVVSSGTTTKVIIVSTPNGLNLFYKMWVDAVEKRSLYIPKEIHWSQVPGRDQKWKEDTIRNTSEEQFRQEFEVEFIGSSATLVSGAKLRSLAFFNPILSEDYFDIYDQPKKGHMYICTVDTSEGVGQDYSTINVVDVTCLPYIQVAKFRDNKMPVLFLPNTIYSIGMKYNEAFVLIETNNIGQQVVDILHYDLEYDNIFKLEQHHIKGTTISAGFKRSTSIGIKTTKTVKKIGCANLKTLIENDKLIINDFDTIAELNTFVRVRDSYAADDGCNDDLVMGLVLFGWLSSQSYFKDTNNIDIRRILMEEQNLIEETLIPVGFIDNGIEDSFFYDGLDVWERNDNYYS